MILGCHDGGEAPKSICADTESVVTYQGTIRPLVERHCVTCHRVEGIAPFSLDAWPNVRSYADKMIDAVERGHMPPAQTDPGCRVMEGQRYLRASERALLQAWREGGYLEGDVCAYVPPAAKPAEDPLPAPSMELQLAEPLTLSNERYDDYRYAYIDFVFEEDTYVLATEFVSDHPRFVHHATVLVDDPSGHSVAAGAVPVIGGQLPGTSVFKPPLGSAMLIPAGSRLYLDLHYHVHHVHEGSPAPMDQPRVRLWTLPYGETPDLISESVVRTVHGFVIAGGDAEALIRESFSLPDAPSEIWGFLPHMHTRGVALRAEVIRPFGLRECAIDVLNFDFRWQLIHELPADAYLVIGPDDTLEISCFYDNSAANQPFVDGEQLPAADVHEGPGSLDEMCQLQMFRVRPLAL